MILRRILPLCAALTGCVLGPWTPPARDADTTDAPLFRRDAGFDARDAVEPRDAPDAPDAPDACLSATTSCNGVCVNLRTDLAHCGSCGAACALQNAEAVCVLGACAVSSCATGFGNCDNDSANGCETDLSTSPTSCGGCRTRCPSIGGVAGCEGGRCTIACSAPLANCDGSPANGCEADLTSDARNCSACATVCALPNATPTCTAGRCVISSCASGFADCDGNPANGCEVNVRTDGSNCGRCASPCNLPNAAATCAGGVCAITTCSAGFANCDGSTTNGCEANVTMSLAHCGGCGQACAIPSATAVCASGVCTLSACAAGTANCDAMVANGCETSTRSDRAHCGACGGLCQTNAGTATNACVSGLCRPLCAAGFNDCDGNPANGCETSLGDPSTCGSCGRVCAPGQSCVPSGSSFTCASGCPGGCFTGIGTVANVCTSGMCVPTCAANFGSCDANPANGCETNLRNNDSHCGDCATVCPGTFRCESGMCRP